MAVITTMMEKTPTSTPSSVSAERSLCAARALMAMKKLSSNSASSNVGIVKFHSFRNASTGFIRAARQAGRKPEITPVNNDTITAMHDDGRDMAAVNKKYESRAGSSAR